MDEGVRVQEVLESMKEERKTRHWTRRLKKLSPLVLLSVSIHLLIFLVLSLFKNQEPLNPPEIIVTYPLVDESPRHEPVLPKIEPLVKIDPQEITIEPVIETPTREASSESLRDIVSEIPPELEPESLPMLTLPDPGISHLPATLVGIGQRTMEDHPAHDVHPDRFHPIKTTLDDVTPEGEDAVNRALLWLAEHQEPDGSWLAGKYEGKSHAVQHPGSTTAIALLPFLGAGHTETHGEYQDTVRRGIRYINQRMATHPGLKEKPQFGRNYGSAIVLMALSEASMFGSSSITAHHADIIASELLEQFDEGPGEGWLYTSGGDDLSVSGWIALGLKSAMMAHLPVMQTPEAKRVLATYSHWVDQEMTDPKTGEARYRMGGGFKTPSMMWVGMFQKQFLGFPLNDPFLEKATENTLEILKTDRVIGGHLPGDVYQVYYGTLASFQQGGLLWDRWNKAMVPTLTASQLPGDPKELGGSWNPTKGHTADVGGRVYTTAMMALCLEVVYRYEKVN